MSTRKIQILGGILSPDETLSISGRAADAKAVGDKIEEVREYYIAPYTAEEILQEFDDGSKFAAIGYYTNLEDLVSNRRYKMIIPEYIPPEGYTSFTNGSWFGTINCDDGTVREFILDPNGMYVTKTYEKKWILYTSNSVGGVDYYYVDLTDKSTSNNIIVEHRMRYLTPGNNAEYTPTTDYSPATKKYVDDVAAGIPEQIDGFVAYDKVQNLTEEQQMQTRENLGLYGNSEVVINLAVLGPDVPGYVWDCASSFPSNFSDEAVNVEIWDVTPNVLRHSGTYVRQGITGTSQNGGSYVYYYWGNITLIQDDGEVWHHFEKQTDEQGYEEAPFVVYRVMNEDEDINCLRCFISGDFEPAYHVGFFVNVNDIKTKTVCNKIPEEYMPDNSTSAVQYIKQDLIDEQIKQARKNLGLYYLEDTYHAIYEDFTWGSYTVNMGSHIGHDQLRVSIDDNYKTWYQRQGYAGSFGGATYADYWWGNSNLLNNVSNDEELYPNCPFVIYAHYNENTGEDYTKMVISSDIAPDSSSMGFFVRINIDQVESTMSYNQIPKNCIEPLVAEDVMAVPRPATATVGQILSVKAVDENGKPTEWEAVDSWVITSSTEGSTKRFKIVVDDSGTLTVAEIVETTTTE